MFCPVPRSSSRNGTCFPLTAAAPTQVPAGLSGAGCGSALRRSAKEMQSNNRRLRSFMVNPLAAVSVRTFDAGGRLPRSMTIREWKLEKTQEQGWKFRPGTAIGCRQRQAALWSNSMDSTLTQRTARRNPIVSEGLTKTGAKLHDR